MEGTVGLNGAVKEHPPPPPRPPPATIISSSYSPHQRGGEVMEIYNESAATEKHNVLTTWTGSGSTHPDF